MNENEARLVYKNKITKITNLALFILSAILVYLTSFFSALLLIADGEKDITTQVFDLIFFVFSMLALIFTAVRIGLMFVHSKGGLSRARYHAIDVVKLMITGTLILSHLVLGIGVFGGGVGSSNSGLVYFLRGYCIFIFVLEVIVFIYRLWRMAWIKENPERIYGTLAVSKADSSKAPAKTSSKTPSKSPKPVEIEATPKAIGAIDVEVKEIEVKK